MKVAITRDDASFDEAFAAARQAGADEFAWNGKRYHTRRDDDPDDQPRPVVLDVIDEG